MVSYDILVTCISITSQETNLCFHIETHTFNYEIIVDCLIKLYWIITYSNQEELFDINI